MTRPRPVPRQPDRRWCVLCGATFPDLWTYKGHQDACIAARRAS